MRHFNLIALLLVFSIACFGQEVKPKLKPKPVPQPAKTVKSAVTKAKSKTQTKVQPKTQPSTAHGEAVKVKPEAKPKPTIAGQTDSTKAKTPNKPKTPLKAESKPKPKPKSTATQIKSPKVESKEKPKQQPKITTQSKAARAEAEARAKPQTKTEQPKPKVEQPKPAVVKPKVEPSNLTSAELKAKPKPETTFEPCNLTLKDAPVIRNLRLGMSRRDADRIIPNDTRINYINSSTITSYPYFTNAVGFENVYQITAKFQEEKLNALEIDYDTNAVEWKNAQEFARNLSDNLRLPFKAWKFARNGNSAEIRCKEFSVEIDSSLNELTLQSITSEDSEQENKKVFKP